MSIYLQDFMLLGVYVYTGISVAIMMVGVFILYHELAGKK